MQRTNQRAASHPFKGVRAGFTLIELLVVIAIIAILAAILFPVFAQARDKARQATCLSNQKQILLAILAYVQDYDEMLPRGRAWDPPAPCGTGTDYVAGGLAAGFNTDGQNDQVFGIENAVDPYVKAGQPWGDDRRGTVWHCPKDTLVRHDCSPSGPNKAVGYAISYSFTRYNPRSASGFGLFARGGRGSNVCNASNSEYFETGGGPINSRTLAGIGVPADTVMMFEFYGADAGYSRFVAGMRTNAADVASPRWTDYPATMDIGDGCGDGTRWLYTMGSHQGVMNIGWADGHVKAARRLSLIAGVSPTTGAWDGVSRPNRVHWDESFH
ncbi:MAG: prepilin-type N-terminal cleavage/methylation domain-containing protein [Capsulimonadales bacterium]|nr:prepilin-type N-terminal cleavage/methylation domain-containing protein [Capsulimonadales bacterium]